MVVIGMEEIHYIAALSYVDELLDELLEDYGDLPLQVKDKETIYNEKKLVKEETEQLIKDIKNFSSKAKVTLVELKDKEEKLVKQQFMVRNNKEFDAISKEIEYLQSEHKRLSEQMRTEGVKIENLTRILDSQTKAMELAKSEWEEMKKELDLILNEQDEELKNLKAQRDRIVKKLKQESVRTYENIRVAHKDAAVKIVKGSCAGFTVPAQLLNEARNNLDTLYFDENSGRILIPEEIEDVESYIDNL